MIRLRLSAGPRKLAHLLYAAAMLNFARLRTVNQDFIAILLSSQAQDLLYFTDPFFDLALGENELKSYGFLITAGLALVLFGSSVLSNCPAVPNSSFRMGFQEEIDKMTVHKL